MTTTLRPELVKFDFDKFRHSTQETIDFIQQLIWSQPGMEKREARRLACAFPAVVVPLDENLKQVGPQFVGVLRNISNRGLSLLLTLPIDSKYIAAELSIPHGEKFQVLVDVRHCRLIGSRYDVGGRFVHRKDEEPAPADVRRK